MFGAGHGHLRVALLLQEVLEGVQLLALQEEEEEEEVRKEEKWEKEEGEGNHREVTTGS